MSYEYHYTYDCLMNMIIEERGRLYFTLESFPILSRLLLLRTRPIAMGETFSKLAGLYCLSLIPSKDIRAILEPIQFALSPGGSETAVHVLNAALDLHSDWVVLSADITNAFNCRKRSQILASLFREASLGPLFRLVHWSYGNSSPLIF